MIVPIESISFKGVFFKFSFNSSNLVNLLNPSKNPSIVLISEFDTSIINYFISIN